MQPFQLFRHGHRACHLDFHQNAKRFQHIYWTPSGLLFPSLFQHSLMVGEKKKSPQTSHSAVTQDATRWACVETHSNESTISVPWWPKRLFTKCNVKAFLTRFCKHIFTKQTLTGKQKSIGYIIPINVRGMPLLS